VWLICVIKSWYWQCQWFSRFLNQGCLTETVLQQVADAQENARIPRRKVCTSFLVDPLAE
jgi:hypothetical protein